jgi:hypothetical protein
VGDSFAVIRDALAEHGGQQALVDLATRAVDDEVRHAELSRVVASRFAGRELEALPRLPAFVPEHPQASPALRRTLWVVGQCCLNETIASAVLEASLEASTGALACAALRELLSDEIDHARIGWGHVAALDAETRAALAPWLYNLTRSNVRTWRTTPRDYPPAAITPLLVAHGALSAELLEGAILTALRELVIPGFAQVGLSTDRIARWVEDGAPTQLPVS